MDAGDPGKPTLNGAANGDEVTLANMITSLDLNGKSHEAFDQLPMMLRNINFADPSSMSFADEAADEEAREYCNAWLAEQEKAIKSGLEKVDILSDMLTKETAKISVAHPWNEDPIGMHGRRETNDTIAQIKREISKQQTVIKVRQKRLDAFTIDGKVQLSPDGIQKFLAYIHK